MATNINFSPYQYFGSSAEICGYEFTRVSTTTFTLNAGYARAHGNDFAIEYPGNVPNLPATITVDVSTTGANGCYPNSLASLALANTTIFPIMMLGDSSGKNSPVAIVETCSSQAQLDAGAFLISGYDCYRVVGAVIIDTSNHVVPMLQTGSFEDRCYQLADAIQVLNAGAATTAANVDLSSGNGVIVPGWCKTVQIRYSFTANAASNTLSVAPTGLTSTTYPIVIQATGTTAMQGVFNIVPGIADGSGAAADGNASINYVVTAGTDAASMWISGFEMSFKLARFLSA